MHLSLKLSLLGLLLAGTAGATGPSIAEAKLFPLAARKGAVLFRTRWEVNPMGAHAFMRTQYGWLVIDARGRWEEAPHLTLEPDAEGGGPWDERRRIDQEEFERPLDWDAPPASLTGLLRKYGFTRKDAVAPDAGKGTVVWTPKALCQGKRCTAACRQRSLRNLRSVTEEAERVEAAFVHSGLALFHNSSTDPDLEPTLGARFSQSAPRGQEPEWDFSRMEYQVISGICRLPR